MKTDLIIKKAATYKRGTEILTMLEKGKELPVKVIAYKNGAKVEFGIEDDRAENAFGFLSKNNSEEVAQIMSDCLSGKNSYTIRLVGADITTNMINAELEYKQVIRKAVGVDTSTFEAEINRIVSKSICNKADLTERLTVMKKAGVHDILILDILKTEYTKANDKCRRPKTVYVEPEMFDGKGKVMKPRILKKCLQNAHFGRAMIYQGDKSVGKNCCEETVAWLLNRTNAVITLNRDVTNETFYGTKGTDNSAQNLLTEDLADSYLYYKEKGSENVSEKIRKDAAMFECVKAKAASISIVQNQSVFVDVVKNGGILCLNEMNLGDGNILSGVLNPLIDGSKFLDIPEVGRIDIHPMCTVIATQNKDYEGVRAQNEATQSRFGLISFEYPDSIKGQLKAAVDKGKLLDDIYFEQTDNLYKDLLKLVHNGDVSNTVLNIRGFVRALDETAEIPGDSLLSENILEQVMNACPEEELKKLTKSLTDFVNV